MRPVVLPPERHPALLPRRPGDRRAARRRARGRPRARGLGRLDDDRVRRGRARPQPPARRDACCATPRPPTRSRSSARTTRPAAAPTRRCSSSCSTPASGSRSTSTRTTPSPAGRCARRYGKTEAWIVIATTKADAGVAAGFREDVAPETLERWVREQDHDAMLGALNPLPVKPGDAIFVPAGTPHAIGDGVLIVELQQPTDLSVLLEWDGFGIEDEDEATLGLGWDVALGCVDLAARDPAPLRGPDPTRNGPVTRLLPAAADAVLPRRAPRAGADRRARARLRDPRRHRRRGRAAGRGRRAAAGAPRRHGPRALGGGPVPPARATSRRSRCRPPDEERGR